MLTIKTVNTAIKKIAPDVELAKGEGCFYFWGEGCKNWTKTCVFVPKLNALGLEDWILELKLRKAEYGTHSN